MVNTKSTRLVTRMTATNEPIFYDTVVFDRA